MTCGTNFLQDPIMSSCWISKAIEGAACKKISRPVQLKYQFTKIDLNFTRVMRISPCLVGIPISPHLNSVNNIIKKTMGSFCWLTGWKDTMEFATPYDLVNAACSTEVPKRRFVGCLGRKWTSWHFVNIVWWSHVDDFLAWLGCLAEVAFQKLEDTGAHICFSRSNPNVGKVSKKTKKRWALS